MSLSASQLRRCRREAAGIQQETNRLQRPHKKYVSAAEKKKKFLRSFFPAGCAGLTILASKCLPAVRRGGSVLWDPCKINSLISRITRMFWLKLIFFADTAMTLFDINYNFFMRWLGLIVLKGNTADKNNQVSCAAHHSEQSLQSSSA